MKRSFIKYMLLCVVLVLSANTLWAQSESMYIYGECETVDGKKYEGYLEIDGLRLWVDTFSANRTHNPYAKYFSSKSKVRFGGGRYSKPRDHYFACRYSSIESLHSVGYNHLINVVVKGGKAAEMKYDYNTAVTVRTELGDIVMLKWYSIKSIRFFAPSEYTILPNDYYELMAAYVETSQGVFYGIINIPKQEFDAIDPSADALYNFMGESTYSDDGYVTLTSRTNELGGVVTGERTRARRFLIHCIKGNRKVVLNDMIKVIMPSIGSVELMTTAVKSIKKGDLATLKGVTYAEGIVAKRLEGSVEVAKRNSSQREVGSEKNKIYSGVLAYDLDESLNIEFLDGNNGGLLYRLLFSAISEISPVTDAYSRVVLHNGAELSVGSYADVNRENDGVMILDTGEYAAWSNIVNIKFKSLNE